MAGSLVTIQLTASLFSKETFLLLNSILFLIAVHGCLCYSVQVTTWREGGIDPASFAFVHTVALALALVFTLANGGSWLFLLSVFCYATYRGNERILFNLQVTEGRVGRAYGVILLALIIEITVAVMCYMAYGRGADRFVLPSLAVLALTVPITLKLLQRGQPSLLRKMLSDKKWMLLMSAHSGLIAINVMSDRLVFSTGLSTIETYLADYLLIFSYCTAAYALTISLIEVKRPALFKLGPVSLSDFLGRGGFAQFSTVAMIVAALSCGGIYGAITLFSTHLGIGQDAPALLFTSFLSIFFLGQGLLSFFHTYYLSERLYGGLFGTWAVSAVVRIVGYLQSDWIAFLAISALSGFSGVAAAFLFAKVRTA